MLGFTVKHLENAPTVGERLQKTRESMGIDLERVARTLKIRTIYLQNLEADAYEKMPADVYAKGFINKYAIFLNLDARTIFTDYEKERRNKLFRNFSSHTELPSIQRSAISITPKTITKIITTFVFIVVGAFLIYQLNFLFGPPKITLYSPEADLITSDDKIEFRGKIELNSNLTINNQEIYIDKEGNFKEEINLQSGINVIELLVKNRINKSVSIVRRIVRN